ncbi:MAG: hypothetical protein FWD28_03975 [Treponema sp.]|nr:hypothetical protein [Treponema sp.]
MKIKAIVSFLSIIVLFVVFAGCGSFKTRVFDPNLTPDQAASVAFHEAIFIKEYNGINVESLLYKPYSETNPKLRPDGIRVLFPPGEALLLFDLDLWIPWGNSAYIFRRDDVIVRYNFEAGKEYTFTFHHRRDENAVTSRRNRWILSMEVWEGIITKRPQGDESRLLNSWDIGEF